MFPPKGLDVETSAGLAGSKHHRWLSEPSSAFVSEAQRSKKEKGDAARNSRPSFIFFGGRRSEAARPGDEADAKQRPIA